MVPPNYGIGFPPLFTLPMIYVGSFCLLEYLARLWLRRPSKSPYEERMVPSVSVLRPCWKGWKVVQVIKSENTLARH